MSARFAAYVILLALPLVLRAAEPPPTYACRWENGVWHKLTGGSGFETALDIVRNRPDCLDTRFERWDAGGRIGPETNTAYFVVFNETGWLLGVRAGGAAVDAITIDIRPAARGDVLDRPPRRVTLSLSPGPRALSMVPMGFPAGYPFRSQRSRPAIMEHACVSASHESRPLLEALTVKNQPLAEGGTLATFFFPWDAFYDCLPFQGGAGYSWRFKIVLRQADGTDIVWGGPPAERDFGVLCWPAISSAQLAGIYRQWLILLGNPAERYQAAQAAARESWTESVWNTPFGDPAAMVRSFERGNPGEDPAFFAARIQPIIDRNQDLAKLIATPDKVNPPPILSMKLPAMQARLANVGTLLRFPAEIEAARQAYLLDRLFHRSGPLPTVQKEKKKKAPDIETLDLNVNKPTDEQPLDLGPAGDK